jgi:hypothetical protein
MNAEQQSYIAHVQALQKLEEARLKCKNNGNDWSCNHPDYQPLYNEWVKTEAKYLAAKNAKYLPK